MKAAAQSQAMEFLKGDDDAANAEEEKNFPEPGDEVCGTCNESIADRKCLDCIQHYCESCWKIGHSKVSIPPPSTVLWSINLFFVKPFDDSLLSTIPAPLVRDAFLQDQRGVV